MKKIPDIKSRIGWFLNENRTYYNPIKIWGRPGLFVGRFKSGYVDLNYIEEALGG
jgi:hypothetical protein